MRRDTGNVTNPTTASSQRPYSGYCVAGWTELSTNTSAKATQRIKIISHAEVDAEIIHVKRCCNLTKIRFHCRIQVYTGVIFQITKPDTIFAAAASNPFTTSQADDLLSRYYAYGKYLNILEYVHLNEDFEVFHTKIKDP